MSRWFPLLSATLLVGFAPAALAARRANLESSPSPRVRDVMDINRRIDVNRINMFITNFGSFGWDLTTGNPGLIYPKGSGKTALFAGGLWVGAQVGVETRVTVAEYSQEYFPGAMVGGLPDDPFRAEYISYKVMAWRGGPADTGHVDRTPAELGADPQLDALAHHSWSEYMAGAAPHGAPWRLYRLAITDTPAPGDSVDIPGPDVSGDQMLWSVYNDADPSIHTNDAGGTSPLGIEVQQSIFAFDDPGALGSTVFLRYRIINKWVNTLDNAYVAVWSDPDIGGLTDDLAGCDVPLDLGYAYNATIPDAIYGNSPPAVGFDVLRGPGVGPLSAFNRYINGTDPDSPSQSYNYMQGLMPDGSDFIDPTTGLPTLYTHSGDPLTGIGWIDSAPADRRIFAPSGPFTMSPGDTIELLVALVIGQGDDHLQSIAALKCYDRDVQNTHDHGLARPFPEPLACAGVPVNCPRSASYWAGECAPGTQELTDEQIGAIAAAVGGQATTFEWADGASFCATLAGGGDVRALAKREFATLIANVTAGIMGIAPPAGNGIRLNPPTPIVCTGSEARTIGELIETAAGTPDLLDVVYQNLVLTHRRALEGVGAGLPHFNGGASLARDFFGSSLDPAIQPDAFGTVQLTFSHFYRQKAHRYLRLEVEGTGVAPPQGRGFLYAGLHDVNFKALDVTHGVQRDVGFVERCITDAAGTILPPWQQVATFDSTWAPDDSDIGGREYLIVYATTYDGLPKPELIHDGGPIDGTQPALYALWSHLRTMGDVIDDGDRLDFLFGIAPSPGVDQDLLALESQSLSDPAVVLAYQRIVECLEAINLGIGIGPTCGVPTATQASLVRQEIVDGRVRLTWHLGGAPIATLERRAPEQGWAEVARLVAGGDGLGTYEDGDVEAGGRYGYRLAILDGGSVTYAGEIWVDLDGPRLDLALEGVRPNPSAGDLDVAFVLPARGAGTLELIDVAGRRLVRRDLAGLEAGRHVERLAARRIPAGLYLVRLSHGGRALTTKAVLIR